MKKSTLTSILLVVNAEAIGNTVSFRGAVVESCPATINNTVPIISTSENHAPISFSVNPVNCEFDTVNEQIQARKTIESYIKISSNISLVNTRQKNGIETYTVKVDPAFINKGSNTTNSLQYEIDYK